MAGGADKRQSSVIGDGSHSTTYKNPLKQDRKSGFLSSIEEESLSDSVRVLEEVDRRSVGDAHVGEDRSLRRACAMAKSSTDPFNQPPACRRGRREAYEYAGAHLGASVPGWLGVDLRQSCRTLGRQKTRFFDRVDSKGSSNASSYASGDDILRCASGGRLRAPQGCAWLATANKILQFVLMVLCVVLIVAVLVALATVAQPAKNVLIRAGRILGENSIVFSNVTIDSTKMNGLELKNIPKIGDVLGEMFAPANPVESMSKSLEGADWLRMPWDTSARGREGAADETLVMKDAPEEEKDPFLEWCTAAPCAQGVLKGKCAEIGRSIAKGSRNGIPVLPFPRDFCRAFRQLNRSDCLCDKNITSIPDGERLFQTKSLITTMCGFREELKTCG